MKPSYKLTGDKYHINGRGDVYTAMTTCKCIRDDLKKLIGTKIEGVGTIIGVESFAVESQSFKDIGLLIDPMGKP